MSERDKHSKASREERLAENLRANLRRRKQAARKAKNASGASTSTIGQNPDKPSP